MNIAIIYGSTYGDTADAAEGIAASFQTFTGTSLTLLDVATTKLADLEPFDVLLLGCSTWNVGELQADWDEKLAELDDLDLRGKQVALFGAGDQLGYPDTFQDALGILAGRLEARGARLKGLWPVDGYEHTASLAQRGRHFVGLALDYTNPGQAALTDGRIERWVSQLIGELSPTGGTDAPRETVST